MALCGVHNMVDRNPAPKSRMPIAHLNRCLSPEKLLDVPDARPQPGITVSCGRTHNFLINNKIHARFTWMISSPKSERNLVMLNLELRGGQRALAAVVLKEGIRQPTPRVPRYAALATNISAGWTCPKGRSLYRPTRKVSAFEVRDDDAVLITGLCHLRHRRKLLDANVAVPHTLGFVLKPNVSRSRPIL